MDTINKITSDIENKSNKELIQSMDYLSNEFDKTKNSIISLTHYLDNVELSYNKILKEYQKRQNGVG